MNSSEIDIHAAQRKIVRSILLINPELFLEIRQLCREMERKSIAK